MNFFQNHRNYVKSRSDKQLKGATTSASQLSDCSPLEYYGDAFNGPLTNLSNLALYPCGNEENNTPFPFIYVDIF